MSSQTNPVFYFPFKRLVWKLLIDESSSVLVAELRDEENREVNFAAIDLIHKKLSWSSLPIKEKWWLGLEALQNGLVLLHGYKDIQNPEHQGLYMFDVQAGKPLWEKSVYTFVRFWEGSVLVYDPQIPDRQYMKLSPKEGNIVGEMNEEEVLQMLSKKPREERFNIANSHHYTPENKYFEKISGFIEAFTGKKPEGALDYLEYQRKIIASFYLKEGEKTVNYLLVVNEDGRVMYLEQIGSEVKGIGLDTFFLYKDLLIFVKNKEELVIFEI